MPRTLPDNVFEGVDYIMRIFDAMMRAAQHQHKKKPANEGLYPVTLIMNGEGEIVCDKQGGPIIVVPPLTLARTDEHTAQFVHTEQHLSPKHVADLADVHVATVKRAVYAGELPKPVRISSRRVAHRLTDVQDWLASRKKGTR